MLKLSNIPRFHLKMTFFLYRYLLKLTKREKGLTKIVMQHDKQKVEKGRYEYELPVLWNWAAAIVKKPSFSM